MQVLDRHPRKVRYSSCLRGTRCERFKGSFALTVQPKYWATSPVIFASFELTLIPAASTGNSGNSQGLNSSFVQPEVVLKTCSMKRGDIARFWPSIPNYSF